MKKIKLNINSESVSCFLTKAVGYTFSLSLILLAVMLCALGIKGESFFSNFMGKSVEWLYYIFISIFIYACKIYLLIIPIVLCIQFKNYIKYKIKSDWIVKNICYWVILALISSYVYYSNVREEECMRQCVLPDNSNLKECAFDTCDFVF